MRKHFLILMLLALLPLSGWAVSFLDETVTASANDAPYNTAPGAVYVNQQNPGSGIKGGITVFINNVQTFDWDWDGKFYRTSADAAAESASGVVTPATGFNTPSVGTYYIRIVPTTQANSDYKVIALIIKKAVIPNYTAPAGYSGQEAKKYINQSTEQKLIKTGGVCDYGEFRYSLDGTTWEEDKDNIKGKNAGTYAVYFKIIGGDNYDDLVEDNNHQALKINVTIEQKNLPEVNVTNYVFNKANSYTYTAAEQAPTFTVKDGNDDITDDLELTWYTAADLSGSAVAPRDARTGDNYYYAKLTAKNNGNYTGDVGYDANDNVKKEWKFQINKKNAIIYVENKSKVYNGQKIAMNDEGTEITGAKITANGVIEAGIKANLRAKFTDDQYNGTNGGNPAVLNAPSNADSYAMTAYQIANITNGADDINKNYNPTYMQVGSYTISRRPVTVNAKNQTFIYDGTAQALDTDASDATVEYTSGTAQTEEGFITGETAATALFPYIVISKSGEFDIKECVNENYTGGIVISEGATAVNNSNYEIIPGTAGNIIVNGKALVMIAGSFEKEYGYPVDFSKDFAVLTNDPNVTFDAESDPQPTYTVTSQTNPAVTYNAGDVLPIGKYTVAISNVAAITPKNYAVAAENLYTGEIEITRKHLEITINNVALNTGDGIDELRAYGDVDESYKAELVTEKGQEKDVVAFNLKFVDGILENGKIKEAGQYVLVGGAIEDAVDGEEILSTEEAPNQNAKYIISFVKADIILGGAKTLKLDAADEHLLTKINAAATACAAEQAVTYNISFGSRELASEEWHAYVLPFEIKIKDLSAAVDYAIFNVLDLTKTGAAANVNGSKNVYFKIEMDKIKANQPFLMKVKSDDKNNMDDVHINGVKVQEVTATVSVDSKVEGVTEFTGLYGNSVTIAVGSKDRFLATNPTTHENKWWEATQNSYTVLPLDAYLKMETGSGARVFIEDFENGTTAIKELGVDGTAKAYNVDGWYTLNGVKLQGAPTEKGIYINNGKKIVIK